VLPGTIQFKHGVRVHERGTGEIFEHSWWKQDV
jgi:hypothetical protein